MTAFDEAKALFIEGAAALQAVDFVTAEGKFRASLALVPDRVSVLGNLAVALVRQHRLADAAVAAARVVELDPRNAAAWTILADARSADGRLDDALAAVDRLAALQPDDPGVAAWRASLLASTFRFAEAAAAYDRVLALRPRDPPPYLEGERMHARMRVCDWRDFAAEHDRLLAGAKAGRRTVRPSTLLSLTDDPEIQLAVARRTIADEHPPQPARWQGEPYGHQRIRVAYLSPDFREHPVTYLTAGLIEHHDRSAFEVTGIDVGRDDGSPARRRILAAFDRVVPARAWSDGAIAAWVRDAEVDVLVDLAGHTHGGRLGVLAERPAPVQVNYLGYPGTSGAPYVDYILADRFVIPPSAESACSEKVVRLPACFQANDDRRFQPTQAPSRSGEGLREGGFVFASFNNTYKLTPEFFDVWMRLLRRVPGSVLWLVADAAAARASLLAEAGQRGVAAGQLVFANRVSYADHLARLRAADLFLDTLPFNAGTTASDALWAGLPLITVAGQGFAARMAGSLLCALGLPELVTASLPQYEALAFRLATDPAALADVRSRLAEGRQTSPLFDTARFTRDLEGAYRTMVQRSEVGLAPEGFAVDPA